MRAARLAALAAAALAGACAAQTPALFPPGGPSAAAVRQGTLGSCYFHATIAALAAADPQALAQRLQPVDGGWVVSFVTGPEEHVAADDVQYARSQGFDQSDGMWVGALLRAYSQRVLRTALRQAVHSEVSIPLLREPVDHWLVDSNDVLNAYDHAIRAVIDQNGNLSPALLQNEFHRQLGQEPLPAIARSELEDALASHGVFTAVSAMVQQNGEIFGAYRSAGNGGLPLPVMAAFRGPGQAYQNYSASAAGAQLEDARLHGYPAVAATGPASFDELRQRGAPLPAHAGAWFVASHAYTVLGFDGANVTLRNPWGHHPDPSGVFTVPLPTFAAVFPELFIQKP